MSNQAILTLKNITKEFTGVKALSDVSISIHRGDIHVIAGENGAGKSTLMKILSGVHPYGSYRGEIFLEGKPRKFHNVKESEQAGIGIIHQELTLVPNMSVCENLFLGNEIVKNGLIDWDVQYQKAQAVLKTVSLEVDPTTPVKYLGVGQQQLVEVTKALTKNVKVLLLDEPTASLNERESRKLLDIMNYLRKEKNITCVFISHRLEEILSITDAITVLRDGVSIVEREENSKDNPITEKQLIQHMVGRTLENRYPKIQLPPSEEVIFEVKDWNIPHPKIPNKKLIDNASFKLFRNEILGISGLMGAGRTELATSVFGALDLKHTGAIYLEGKKIKIKHPRDAISAGIAYVTEDRKAKGFVRTMNILENVIMPSLEKFSTCLNIIKQLEAIKEANEYCSKMRVKTPSIEQKIVNLSGGNQQKAILAKWLLSKPKVLILDEPTRGIDVGAKYDIYQLMNELLAQGVGIILISSELPEILGMSDRILVISSGAITASIDRKDANEELIMAQAIK